VNSAQFIFAVGCEMYVSNIHKLWLCWLLPIF